LTDVIGAVSNFSVQYNFAVIGVTLLFMQQAVERETLRNGTVVEHRPFIPNEGQTSALASAVFAGAIFGQLSMGYLGDAIGRPAAMLVCQTLTVAGSLGSAVLSHGESLFMIITVCRFFLGIGVGGQYPLSAVMATEGASPTRHKSTAAARAFFWQMPGALSPYVVALLVYVMSGCRTRACNDTATVSLQFRLLLGLGAFPASLGFLFTWIRLRSIAAAATSRTHSEVSDMPAGESAEEEAMNSGTASSQGLAGSSKAKVDLTVFGMCRSVAEHKELWPALIGTGASWVRMQSCDGMTSVQFSPLVPPASTVVGKKSDLTSSLSLLSLSLSLSLSLCSPN
jgi:MFS family permease